MRGVGKDGRPRAGRELRDRPPPATAAGRPCRGGARPAGLGAGRRSGIARGLHPDEQHSPV